MADRLWTRVRPVFEEIVRKLYAEVRRRAGNGYTGELRVSVWTEDGEDHKHVVFKGLVREPHELPEMGKHPVLYWNQKIVIGPGGRAVKEPGDYYPQREDT